MELKETDNFKPKTSPHKKNKVKLKIDDVLNKK